MFKMADDIDFTLYGFLLEPQRYWTSFYFRSVKAFWDLADLISEEYGNLDTEAMQRILSTPELVDERDSMNAAVYEPETLRIHYAMGKVPATDAEFVTVDLGELFQGGGL